MNEFELKFEIPPEQLTQILAAVHDKKAQLQIMQACYFDTKDGVLAKHGLILRMRKEGSDWVQTAKGITEDSLERLEHNVKIKASSAKTLSVSKGSLGNGQPSKMPRIDLSRHADEKIGKLLINALNIKQDGISPTLMPLYETDVQRLQFSVKHLDSLIEIALDQGMVVSGARSAALCELEIELKQGNPEHAIALARIWCANYGLWLSTISKSMKGQRLHDQSVSIQLNHDIASPKKPKNGQQMVKMVFQSCLNQILINASEVANGSQNADHIHQLRVGIRRLRTAIRELNLLVDGIDPAWEIPLVAVFRALGEHRDGDILSRELQPKLSGEGGPNINTQHIEATITEPSLVVRSEAFQDTLLCIIGYVHSSHLNMTGEEKHKYQNAQKILARRFDHLHKQIIKKGKKFLSLNETQQHSVRKHFKRLRYLTEFSAQLFSVSSAAKKRISTFIADLKPVQDALGFYNDELMALQTYRKLVVKDKRAWFGAGWLSARRKQNAKKSQQEIDIFIKKTNKNKRFWQ